MKYLKVLSNHSYYDSVKKTLGDPSVSFDGLHVHYTYVQDGVLIIGDRYNNVAYTKTIKNGYTTTIELTMEDVNNLTRLGSPMVAYEDGSIDFDFRIKVPDGDDENFVWYKLNSSSEDDDNHFIITENYVSEDGEGYTYLASYVGLRLAYGLEITIKLTITYDGNEYIMSGEYGNYYGYRNKTLNKMIFIKEDLSTIENPDGVVLSNIDIYDRDEETGTIYSIVDTADITLGTTEILK